MSIALDNSTLLNYFTGIVRHIPAFFYHKNAVELLTEFDTFNPYYFKSANSDTLLVTLGDSWTWAMECTGRPDFDDFYADDWTINNRVISNTNQDRINHAYGNILSEIIASDWLNLGVPGWGNLQIANLVKHLAKVIPNLSYKKIIVVCTFTEIGRWFNTEDDQHIDHARLIRIVEEHNNVDALLKELNYIAVNQITDSLKDFPHVQLLIGTNFVDHLGLDCLSQDQLLPTPWYQLLNISYTEPIYIGTVLGINGFERGLQDGLVPKKLHTLFKSWIVSVLDKSDLYYKSLACTPYFSSKRQHPLFDAQKIWADYVLKHIKL